MRTRFRISENDTIKATISANGSILASVYDSQFTTIGEVVSRLISKVPFTSAKVVDIHIVNQTKEKSIYLAKKVTK